ncbi:MAG TPA: MFS transporter [Longimicrobiaceae bacterium]|nr:MFS transporter [Longimicrobiaceae bacterium]
MSPTAAAGATPARRLYYGWVLVGALGVTETVSYGILSYALPVFIIPLGQDPGWSRTAVTGAFSLASLVAGVAAVPVGRWVDRHGARGVMTAGSCLAVLLLLAWSRVESLPAFYLVHAGLGVAMAATLYEPAFAVVASWFVRQRGRALTVLTFLGGFASVIFVPLATGLVEAYGWRTALVCLAALLALLTLPPHALLLRRRPEELGLAVDGGAVGPAAAAPPEAERSVPAREAVRSRSFRWLALAFGLSALVTTGLTVHLIPLLRERGFVAGFAGAALGAVGVMALPGRLVFTPLGDRWPRPAVTASLLALQAAGIAVLLATRSAAGVWTFVVLFGAGFGAITPARAALLADLYGRDQYARIGGVLALGVALARAAAPVGVSLLYAAEGGYQAVLWTLLGISAAAGVAVLAAGRGEAGPPPSTTEENT